MATFITSKSVGDTLNMVDVNTSTGFWKYNHNGADSSVFPNGYQTITVANANGEFTLIPCDNNGNVTGNLTYLAIADNQLTSFNGTGLTSLTNLNLYYNQLTSFDGTDLTSLTTLSINSNQLTSFDGTGLSSLTTLNLSSNSLTSFDGTGLSSLTTLYIENNQLTSFDGTDLSSLTNLNLSSNSLTSFDGTGLSSLTSLELAINQLTSFNGTDLSSLTALYINSNQLTSLDVSNLNLLNSLTMYSSKTGGNPMTPSSNDAIINKFLQNAIANNFSTGFFESIGGRTSASSSAYNALIGYPYNFTIQGNLDLVSGPVVGSGRLAVRGIIN
jgi:Leucine-rich repeat (LRR) protein